MKSQQQTVDRAVPSSPDFRYLLRIAAFLILFSRGWLFLRWASPLREVLWFEDWMAGPVNFLLHITWETYATTSDPYITLIFKLIGSFLMLCGIAALVIQARHRRGLDALLLSFVVLLAHQFSAWHAKDFQIGMLLELTLQSLAPALLWLHVKGFNGQRLFQIGLIASALTFIGHGLYAVAYHPLPAPFVTMAMDTLGCSESSSRLLLKIAGWLDFIVAIAIFIPRRKLQILALSYMILWGFVTALARIVANYSPALAYHGVDPWAAETLVRSAHWIGPLWLLLGLIHCDRSQK